jgi:hypothetical protein
MAKWDHDDLRNRADEMQYKAVMDGFGVPMATVIDGVIVTNTPRAGESAEQTAARTAPRTVLGTQVGGDHYTKRAIQPIEYIWANGLEFSEGNVVKYVTRWKDKGGIKDLEKAKHHIELLIERERKRGLPGA